MQSKPFAHIDTMQLVAITILLICVFESNAELRAVLQFYRHGERTPIGFHENDPYKDPSYWGGLETAQLTDVGKRQMYALGQYTKKRYSKFIPDKYHKKSYKALTVDLDRTLQSAQSNIYGLFPATGDQVWLTDVNWQPIPVHPINRTHFNSDVFPYSCPTYDTLFQNLMKSPEYQAINYKYSSVLKYLREHSGKNVTDIFTAADIYDTLKIEEGVGYKLPSWAESVYPEPLYSIMGLALELATHTTEMKRYVTGVYLNDLMVHLEGMVRDSNFRQPFFTYSLHDFNMASLLNSLGAFNPPFPTEFASSIYIELHLQHGKPYVQTYFLNGNSIQQISVNGCSLVCPLAEFKKRLSHIYLSEETRNAECRTPLKNLYNKFS